MFKFAHLADIHLGAYRDNFLKEANLNAFLKAMDICIQENVDFIIISGDLFDSNLPDIKILNSAVKKMKEVKNNGIEIYVIYGSHDYSPVSASMIDILHSAGLFVKLEPNFIKDKKTKANIAGISARKAIVDKQIMQEIKLQRIDENIHIFVFHAAIDIFTTEKFLEPLPFDIFPKGMDYYAGGHLHKRDIKKINNSLIAYPGPLFGYDYRDLESTAKGDKKGFYIVEFDSHGIKNYRFIEINVCEIDFIEYDAEGKSSLTVENDLMNILKIKSFKDKIVLLKIKGRLSSGKPGDIDFEKIRKDILEKEAKTIYINRNQLIGKEEENIEIKEENPEEIEKRIFEEFLKKIQFKNKILSDSKTCLELLNAIKEENIDEKKAEYEKRIVEKASKILFS
jgi:DNA repair exonuclease SbcCD nuclease subunit